MIFTETPLSGAYIIDPERIEDERGFFARTWCQREFSEHGLITSFVQCSVSVNHKQGTLRGMHYQVAPHAETKLVRCTSGAIYDVIVDLRPESASYRKWFGTELSAGSRRALYIPAGMAHGFLTLSNDAEVFYQISDYYFAESARGVRWDDHAISIQWPFQPKVMSDRDRTYPDYVST